MLQSVTRSTGWKWASQRHYWRDARVECQRQCLMTRMSLTLNLFELILPLQNEIVVGTDDSQHCGRAFRVSVSSLQVTEKNI